MRRSCEIPALRVFVSEYVCMSPRTYLCVFRYISKSDFFKKPQSPSKRERDSRSVRQTEKVREREAKSSSQWWLSYLPCLQTDTLLKIPIGNGQHSIKSELSQSVVKRQTTEICCLCLCVGWDGGFKGAFHVNNDVFLSFHANKSMHVMCVCVHVLVYAHAYVLQF